MINEPKPLNLEKLLEILDILGNYIDENNELKPEFYVEPELLMKCISIFSGSPIEELSKEKVIGSVFDIDEYTKVNDILKANKIMKRFRLR